MPENNWYMEGHEQQGSVEAVYESFGGSYWVIVDTDSDGTPFGYACLNGMRHMSSWGRINPEVISDTRAWVWEVDEKNWPHTGPEHMSLYQADEIPQPA